MQEPAYPVSKITAKPTEFAEAGSAIEVTAWVQQPGYEYVLQPPSGWLLNGVPQAQEPWAQDLAHPHETVHWVPDAVGGYTIDATFTPPIASPEQVTLRVVPRLPREGTPVTMRRAAMTPTLDIPLWVIIRRSSEQLGWRKYRDAMNYLLCGQDGEFKDLLDQAKLALPSRHTAFTDADAYRVLKVATEAFVMVNCGVVPDEGLWDTHAEDASQRLSSEITKEQLQAWWDEYTEKVNGAGNVVVPYLARVREGLRNEDLIGNWDWLAYGIPSAEPCLGLLKEKVTKPCLLELIWSYWHEEGKLVEVLSAVSRRFQNVRALGDEPLAFMEIGYLRPINNAIWGYVQDQQHRLTALRRAYEYDHHYGLRTDGRAAPPLRTADSRTKFLEAFHNLLYMASVFYREDDDTTVNADAFPMLNALKDVHLVLSEGAHNQFGDLPSTARIEMLMEQWLLARPEFREFLPTRESVAYPEEWMGRVDAMKGMMGWTDTSVLHFRNLAVFGEQLLLSIRYGDWNEVSEPAQAGNWARYWRAEVQGYVHAYRAVTGVDLTAEITDARQAQARYLMPSVHLRARLAAQQRALPAGSGVPALARVSGRPGLIRRPR